MSLKITKSDEVIEIKNIFFSIYALPGLGKTSLAFTASRPLLFDFDKGSYRAVNRKDVVLVTSWKDVAGITAQDVADFDTIIIDTAGKAIGFLAADVMASDSSYGYSGVLNLRGWGVVATRFKGWLEVLQGFGKDIIIIAHMDEKTVKGEIKERLKIPGGANKDLILADSDVIARISIVNKHRNLVFTPTEASFGKDPGNIGGMIVPHGDNEDYPTCLADIITNIKETLNSMSAAQVERREEEKWFTEALPKMETIEEINAVLSRARTAGHEMSLKVVARAKELEFVFDKPNGTYNYKEGALNV